VRPEFNYASTRNDDCAPPELIQSAELHLSSRDALFAAAATTLAARDVAGAVAKYKHIHHGSPLWLELARGDARQGSLHFARQS
jgi:hypothetical protein